MINIGQLKRFGWSVAGATGIIIFWRGLWEGSSYIPYLENLWVTLVVGLTMMAFSAFKFQDFPLEASERIIKNIQKHPQKHEFHLKYKDNILSKEIAIVAHEIKKVKNNFIMFQGKDGGFDYFIPTERINEITFQGKTHWKREKTEDSKQ